MDAFTDSAIETVVLMSAAQVGKTEILNNVVGFFIDQDPAPILVMQPNVNPMAHAWSKDRLAPMLRDTPALQGKVQDPRSRDSGNTVTHKIFPGGHITVVGANSAAGLAARPIRIVLCDEVDRYPASAGSEGDPVSLAFQRAVTFWNRKRGLFSTPTLKDFSRIHDAFLEGDQRTYHVPCPHCGEHQPLMWKGLVWEKADDGTHLPETVQYCCADCGSLIDETEKSDMLDGGEWVAAAPGRVIASFHLNALYSPWKLWTEIVREFLAARMNPERLQVWVNAVLGEVWEEQGEQANPDDLRARREAYPAEVPAGVGMLTAAVDIQADRLEVEVTGWGIGQESWLIAHHRIYGDPVGTDPWERLEVFLTRPYEHECGTQLRIRACLIDSGFQTAAVYRFVRSRQRRGVFAAKGISGRGRPIVGRPSKGARHGVKLFPIGVDSAKDVLFARLRIAEPGPGYLHFCTPSADGADDEYLAQLAAEKAVTRFVKGVPTRRYVQVRARNEAIDLKVLALAALHVLGPAVTDHLDRWVRKLQTTKERTNDGDQTPQQAQTRKRKRSFVHRWRP